MLNECVRSASMLLVLLVQGELRSQKKREQGKKESFPCSYGTQRLMTRMRCLTYCPTGKENPMTVITVDMPKHTTFDDVCTLTKRLGKPVFQYINLYNNIDQDELVGIKIVFEAPTNLEDAVTMEKEIWKVCPDTVTIDSTDIIYDYDL